MRIGCRKGILDPKTLPVIDSIDIADMSDTDDLPKPSPQAGKTKSGRDSYKNELTKRFGSKYRDADNTKTLMSELMSLGKAYDVCSCCDGTVDSVGSPEDSPFPSKLLQTLRILSMSEVELYFAGYGEPKHEEKISPRNEIRSLVYLRKLLAALPESPCRNACVSRVTTMISQMFDANLPNDPGMPIDDEEEAACCRRFEGWCVKEGVSTALTVRSFPGTGRGMAAARDLGAGETIISIPTSLFLNTEGLNIQTATSGDDASTSSPHEATEEIGACSSGKQAPNGHSMADTNSTARAEAGLKVASLQMKRHRFGHVFERLRGLDEPTAHILLVLLEVALRPPPAGPA